MEVPLLDLVEAGEERDGDEDDDSLFAVADLELFGVKEVLLAKLYGFFRDSGTGGRPDEVADLLVQIHSPYR